MRKAQHNMMGTAPAWFLPSIRKINVSRIWLYKYTKMTFQ
jgi:hypothetical protein